MVAKALGNASYDVSPSTVPCVRGKRSLYVVSYIKPGEVFFLQMFARSLCFGMHPKYFSEILGKKAKIELQKGDCLAWDVVDDNKI